jgi:DMSO/TMAO reductase YedYZ heme-binding membrane subunit
VNLKNYLREPENFPGNLEVGLLLVWVVVQYEALCLQVRVWHKILQADGITNLPDDTQQVAAVLLQVVVAGVPFPFT